MPKRKKHIKHYLWLQTVLVLLAGWVLLQYVYFDEVKTRSPEAVQGVLDIRAADMQQDPISLNGQWDFYWGQLLAPELFHDPDFRQQPAAIDVPDKWNSYTPTQRGDGVATYHLRVKMDETCGHMALKIPEIATAYRLYIDRQLVAQAGEIGLTAAGTKAQYLPQLVSFSPARPEFDIVVQVANFAHHKGGLKSALYLGCERDVQQLREKEFGFSLFLLGIFLIMSVYHFGLYWLRRNDKPALYFGWFCLLIAIRTISTGELAIVRLWPQIPWELLLKIEYLSYYLAVPAFFYFIYELYEEGPLPRFVKLTPAISLAFSMIVLAMPVKLFSKTLLPYDLFTFITCLYVGWILVRAIRQDKEGAGSFATGVFIFLATVINDMLNGNGWIHSAEMVPLGLFMFVFFQAMALSTRFSRAYLSLESVSSELQQSNETLGHILESITDGFFALDHEGRFTYINLEAERLLQQPAEQLLGKVIWQVLPLAKTSEPYRQYERLAEQNRPIQFEYYWPRLACWVEIHAYPHKEGLSVFIRDIQHRKEQEEKIREYTTMLQEQVRLLDLDPDYTVECNLAGEINFWNIGAEQGYLWTKEEALGQEAHSLLKTKFPQPLADILNEVTQNGRWMGELTQTKKDGTVIVVRSCWLLKRGTGGEPVGILEFNKDITEQKNMEKEMARLDKLHLIGQMAAGISHEVRNPMTTVRGFLQMLLRKETRELYLEYYQLMLSEMDRANEILTEYLSIAKPRSANFVQQNINEIFLTLKPLLLSEANKYHKHIVFNLGAVPPLLLDGAEVRQLILNLCRNGLEAMVRKGDTLTITTQTVGASVRVSVGDQGVGIPQEIIGRLGTPFLSTKDTGTGLGLAVCYGIAARHGATIEVHSDETGTTFTIAFALPEAKENVQE